MIKPISVYDGHTRKRLAYLQNAYDISYDKNTTTLWTAEFSLPFSDPKTRYCQAFNLVEIWDIDGSTNSRYVGLFRIMPRTEETIGTEANIVYQLEHVLSTLLDDTLLGFHEVGNMGIFTAHSIGYILDHQSDPRWVLADCDYAHQFLYGWQDENLLSALFSIVQPFEETDYYWDFDTRSFPWRLSLRKTTKKPKTDIRYRKNLNGLTRTVDPTNLTTRLYCYGYGDGDNKLGIGEVNNGVPYLESPNVSKYGVITQIWNDERFTVAESLLDTGRAMLKRLEEPAVTYELDVQAIHQASSLQIGDTVRVVTLELDELMTVKGFSKDNVTGEPYAGTLVLGEGTIDISNSIAELADRQRIAENYSQGAESIFTDSFIDNADEEHPGTIVFTIPDNAVHVNEILFSCNLNYFRAYSRAVDGGGQVGLTTEDGGHYSDTSESGGSINKASEAGGYFYQTSHSGGGGAPTTTYVYDNVTTSSAQGGFDTTIGITNLQPDNDPTKLHNHGIQPNSLFIESLNVIKNSNGVVTDIMVNRVKSSTGYDAGWRASGDHTHRIATSDHIHQIFLPGHSHSVSIANHSHGIELPNHTHSVVVNSHTHRVNIPSHKHSWSLPNHTHNIEYGVYEHNRIPATMKIYLDDRIILNETGGVDHGNNVDKFNLISYISKDANGKLMRGKHTIKIIPGRRAYNDPSGNIRYDSKARVECTFLIRLFTNMHGGKQY